MSVSISLFPVVDEVSFERLGFEAGPYMFYYTYEREERPLEVEDLGDGSSLKLVDPKGDWNPEDYGFFVRREVVIRHPHVLFGPKGVAPMGSSVGLSMLWLSRSSAVRGAAPFKIPIKNDTAAAVRNVEYEFPPGMLRGEFILTTSLFLLEGGVRSREEMHLAQYPGTILGDLDRFKIVIDGRGSMFPILEIREPSQPLWRVECNWSDPLVDAFDTDSVVIYLNASHPGYKELVQGDLKESYLLKEVTASALHVIIQQAQNSEYWGDIKDGKAEHGSIGEALHYFITTLDWNTESPEQLARSIRSYLDRGM